MEYYKLRMPVRSLEEILDDAINGIERKEPLIPGISGEFVKNKDNFFDTDESGPDKFYDHDYEFDYLVPKAYGDPEPEAEIIADFHTWHGADEPWGGWFKIVSTNFKELLERFNLSKSKFYNARVLFKEKFYPYFVWQILMGEYKQYIDFKNSLFNNRSQLGKLNNAALEVKQFSSLEELKEYRVEHWNRHWNFERLVMKPNFKELDFCMLPLYNEIVSERLKNAIEDAGLTGIAFEELPVKIEFSDEVI